MISVRNLFIISLSVTDIIISIVSGTITPITAFSKIWIFGELLCYFIPLMLKGASLCFSSLTLTAIAIDRYILIIFHTKRPIQKPQAVKIIGLNFALATAISLPIPCSSSKDLSNTRISVANFAPKIGTLITWVAVLMERLYSLFNSLHHLL
ncbi:unnamed protein product [Wuchereria bancrofti]|uniref:G-protein coupled receptors family 1 profile domain-containing protein n=1 Tax=Wuchereria bancrofti TaxID=6293 RepID=A0A3P7FWV7_WUCBA|nr:unnamed protein product [Wuchereria bancrofti]